MPNTIRVDAFCVIPAQACVKKSEVTAGRGEGRYAMFFKLLPPHPARKRAGLWERPAAARLQSLAIFSQAGPEPALRTGHNFRRLVLCRFRLRCSAWRWHG